jgi:beta-xylosidase
MPRPLLAAALLSLFPLAACHHPASSSSTPPAHPLPVLSWGDQGDGTYKNPVLKSDFSDPDVLRVGKDFYLIASDFHFSTMQVLHSNDLVNWQYCGKVFDRLGMAPPKYDGMNAYAEGTWAPSLRYHNGQFYIYVCTPYDGLFMYHAKRPEGPWSDVVTVKAVSGWEDPCPFWDDDGQAYLVHGKKGAGPIIVNKMSPDGTTLLDEGQQIYTGPNAEGPKVHKRHGYYYISLPEGGFKEGGQTMLRSKNIYGPYERREVLAGTGEHQGGFVELDNGQAWFIAFKEQYGPAAALGRICYLEPVTWGDDDWPVFGDNTHPVPAWKKPDVGRTYPITRPATSDDFSAPTLGLQWQWNHNPVNSNWSLTARPGFLRLSALPADSLPAARNTLTQKLWDDHGEITVKLDISALADGDHAGFAFMTGKTFNRIGVFQQAGARNLEWEKATGPALTTTTLWLRGTYTGTDAHFAYSTDGATFTPTPTPAKLGFATWKGSRPTLYCYGPGGHVDIDNFHYTYGSQP